MVSLRRKTFVFAVVASVMAAAFAVETPNMVFEIDDDASNARFAFPRNTAKGKDFWRLILDDGERTEIPVFSHAQKGRVTREGDALTVSYDRVVSDYGDTYDIGFSLRIKKEGDALSFTATIDNRSKVRVNECVAPLVSFNGLVGEKAKDVLYMPRSLGQRSPNPYGKMEGFTQHDYLHNEYTIPNARCAGSASSREASSSTSADTTNRCAPASLSSATRSTATTSCRVLSICRWRVRARN